MSYSPFPERELLRLAEEYDETASKVGPKLKEFYSHRAEMLRNSVACHEALRARFLEQSMTVRELQAERAA